MLRRCVYSKSLTLRETFLLFKAAKKGLISGVGAKNNEIPVSVHCSLRVGERGQKYPRVKPKTWSAGQLSLCATAG